MSRIVDLTPLEVSRWYSAIVGEVGISPTDFYNMTEDEAKWAYEGYRQRQQDLANLILLAVNRANGAHKNDLFKFVEDKGYSIGKLEDRQRTFTILGIEEDEANG